MSRTIRRGSHKMGHKSTDKVKDGSRTRGAHSCENNGGCPYCEANRLHKHNKQLSLKEALKNSNITQSG